jgi:hypothetical protein
MAMFITSFCFESSFKGFDLLNTWFFKEAIAMQIASFFLNLINLLLQNNAEFVAFDDD